MRNLHPNAKRGRMDLIHEMISPNGERKVRVYKRTDGFFEYEEVL